MSLQITAFDGFCGAGGSSQGMKFAGVEVIEAANHWPLAIETHETNHPNTRHHLSDLQKTHPSAFARTNIAWFSPSCTNHSLAKGRKRTNLNQLDLWGETGIDPEEERSRATMREVVEFSEYHHYEIVIVENVVDVRKWQHYDTWLQAMLNLGYEHKTLYLNAMFFGVPQSRDRIYVVFWRKGNKAPNLDFRPYAFCIDHGIVGAVQSWKKADFPWGRYGQRRQYVYCCPQCGRIIEPFAPPASDVIDWSIPSQRIGDRDKPLKPKTVKRILEGLRRFAPESLVTDMAYSHAGDGGKVSSANEPLPTQTTRQTLSLVTSAFLLNYMNQETPPRSVDEPMWTIAGRNTSPLVIPNLRLGAPFLMSYYTRDDAQSRIDAPLPTITGDPRFALVSPNLRLGAQLVSTNNYDDRTIPVDRPMGTLTTQDGKWALLTPPFICAQYNNEVNRAVDEPMPAQMSVNHHALVTPPFLAVLKNSHSRDGQYTLPPRSLNEPLTTLVGSASQHALITPFLMAFRNAEKGAFPLNRLDEPLATVVAAGGGHQALVTPFVMAYYGNAPTYAPTDDPLPTMTAVQRHALVSPEDMLDDCGFRMLEPEELKRGMSFPNEYVILGNKRQQVKQVGNAVACRVAQEIVKRCVESLAG